MSKLRRLEDLTPAEAERIAPFVDVCRRNGLMGTHVILAPHTAKGMARRDRQCKAATHKRQEAQRRREAARI